MYLLKQHPAGWAVVGTPDQGAPPALPHSLQWARDWQEWGHSGVRSPDRAVLIFDKESRKVEKKRGKQEKLNSHSSF